MWIVSSLKLPFKKEASIADLCALAAKRPISRAVSENDKAVMSSWPLSLNRSTLLQGCLKHWRWIIDLLILGC